MEVDNYKKFQKWMFANMVWILIVIALLLMLVIYLDLIKNQKLVNIFEKASLAILSSGIFAAVLKSIQFTGLFKEEIEKVILGTDFIKNRRDLPQLWKTISQTIYKRKFPKISENLENRILDTYFPTNHDYYYEDYIVTINIEEITDDFEIVYTQTCKYRVVLDENVDEIELSLETSISQEEDSSEIINKLQYFKVNNKDADCKEDKSTKDNPKMTKYIIPIKGNGPFEIQSKYNRQYSLKNENYKLFRLKRFTKNMEVVIKYPKNVCVSFFNIGLVNKFQRQHVEINDQISRSHKNDVILPHQGFGMSFELKS
jgi:hypothetical protein